MTLTFKWICTLLLSILVLSCSTQNTVNNASNISGKESTIKTDTLLIYSQQDWVKNAAIYEVNTRQFSKEGTFEQVENQLERIKKLGVDILWFMPIHEIGVKNRKEGLGSYYSVKDYRSVNHEFGNKADFKSLVDKAHSLGMKVIIDWVPNHTSWDHDWITHHPEYYTKNDKGEIIDPTNPETGESWGWTDVADLNYDNKDLWNAMNQDMAYWVTEFDIDGFRCDVAAEVPIEFWAYNNPKLNEIKPLFMLAEADKKELFQYFDMQYAWSYNGLQVEFDEGKKTIQDITAYMGNRNKEELYMYFTTNHDENTWHSAPMKFEENYRNFAVLTFLMGGMPLIYNGQEARLDHELKFFTKDEINWERMQDEQFYKNMISIYKQNPALWNGEYFGDTHLLFSGENTLGFIITKGNNAILVLQNYDDQGIYIDVSNFKFSENLINLIDNSKINITNGKILMPPHNSIIMNFIEYN